MKILVRDLHETGPVLVEKFFTEAQAVAEIGEVRVNSKLPSIAESLDILRFLGQIIIFIGLGNISLVDKGLEV
jgi:hypothetical protein